MSTTLAKVTIFHERLDLRCCVISRTYAEGLLCVRRIRSVRVPATICGCFSSSDERSFRGGVGIMTRTDRRGRPLKACLKAEIASADVTIEEMRRACGLTRASYYGEPSGSGRGFDESFPNSEELRQIAEYYKLGDNGWGSLLVEFGWLGPLTGTLRIAYTVEKTHQLVA